MRKTIQLIVALVAVCSGFAEPIFMKIDGIPGEEFIKGQEGNIRIFALNHEIVSPRDTASGQATGKRQHMPLRCVMQQGKPTPLLFQALTMNKTIPKVEISFYRPNPTGDGTREKYFTYVLTDVSISSVRPWMANIKDGNVADYGTQVEVAFVYRSIVWTYTNGGITHEDSWQTQR
jgi:type VI secretion system secreted protein Hcp